MPIRTVIFDIGGVLLKPKPSQDRDHQWESRLGLPDGELKRIISRTGWNRAATLGQISAHELWQRVGERLALNNEQIHAIESDFRPDDEINTELVNLIQSLRPHYTITAISNAWSDTREALTRKYGLDKIVDAMLFSYEVGVAKPDSRIYQIAISRLAIYPEETIFVDDKSANVDTARLIGMRGIWYKNNEQTIAEIEKWLGR
jgi:epoxide hydrolase-like predicted phosphatase